MHYFKLFRQFLLNKLIVFEKKILWALFPCARWSCALFVLPCESETIEKPLLLPKNEKEEKERLIMKITLRIQKKRKKKRTRVNSMMRLR